MNIGIICTIATLAGITGFSTSAIEAQEIDAITPEVETKIHRPYPSEPRGKKYCEVWVTAKQLLPMDDTKPEVEISEFKSPKGYESEIEKEVFDAITAHKVTSNFYILAKVQEREIVEYRYTYFKNCSWTSGGPTKPGKSLNADGCATLSPDAHRTTLETFGTVFGQAKSADEIIGELRDAT